MNKLLIALVLLIFISGCSSTPTTQPTITRTIHVFPPDVYMTPCRREIPLGSTLKEIIQHQDHTISLCEAKLSSQREWKETFNE